MIHIEPSHRVVREAVSARVHARPEHREAVDVKCDDFEGVTFYVCILPDDKDTMRVSLYVPCFAAIEEAVGKGYFEGLYSEVGAVLETPQPMYSLTAAVNLNGLPDDEAARGEENPKCDPPGIAIGRLQSAVGDLQRSETHPTPYAPWALFTLPQSRPHLSCLTHSRQMRWSSGSQR